MKSPFPMTVCLTFDDGHKSHVREAAPRLEARGWRGAFNVPTAFADGGIRPTPELLADLAVRADQLSLMGWEDVRALMARGHEVYPHTVSHANLAELAASGRADEMEREIILSKRAFEERTGRTPKFFCAPHNTESAEVAVCVRAHGMALVNCDRLDFGGEPIPGLPSDVAAYLIDRYLHGDAHVDLSVHGVTAESGGWRPFADMEAFEYFLDEIAELERRGIVRVVDYAAAHSSRDGAVRRIGPRGLVRAMRRLALKAHLVGSRFLRDYWRYQRQDICLPFEVRREWTGHSEVTEVRLGDLCRYDYDFRQKGRAGTVPLRDYFLYRLLTADDERAWRTFMDRHCDYYGKLDEVSRASCRQRIFRLRDALARDGYDPSRRVIVLDEAGVVVDGCHRATCLLSLLGGDGRVKAVKILPPRRAAKP